MSNKELDPKEIMETGDEIAAAEDTAPEVTTEEEQVIEPKA